MHYKQLVDFHNALHEALGCGPDVNYQVSFRMTKKIQHLPQHDPCVELHRLVTYGRIVCYILHQNVAYALLMKYNLTGVNVYQELPLPEDLLREILTLNRATTYIFVEIYKPVLRSYFRGFKNLGTTNLFIYN